MTQAIETTFEIVPAELGLDLTAKNSLELAFRGFFATAAEWKAKAEMITDPKAARSARLELKAIRVAAEKTRKQLKDDSLRMGKAIDGANNILLAMIVPIEKSLDDIEKEEERRIAAIIEAKRQDRADALETIDHIHHGVNLGTLTDEQWEQYHQQAKDAYFARRERERKAKEESEAAAKKEEEEREVQRLENIRLKAEVEKRESELKAEREAAESERRKAAAAIEKERAEKAKLEAEAKAMREADAKRIAEEKSASDAREKKAAAAPDRSKLQEFAHTVRTLIVPDVKRVESKAVRAEIVQKVANFANWIESQASSL